MARTKLVYFLFHTVNKLFETFDGWIIILTQLWASSKVCVVCNEKSIELFKKSLKAHTWIPKMVEVQLRNPNFWSKFQNRERRIVFPCTELISELKRWSRVRKQWLTLLAKFVLSLASKLTFQYFFRFYKV